MAHKTLSVTAKGAEFYRTRMLRAGDPIILSGPQARLQIALGNVEEGSRQAEESAPRAAGNDLTALRAEYQVKVGRRPFMGWDAATLREKIAAA